MQTTPITPLLRGTLIALCLFLVSATIGAWSAENLPAPEEAIPAPPVPQPPPAITEEEKTGEPAELELPQGEGDTATSPTARTPHKTQGQRHLSGVTRTYRAGGVLAGKEAMEPGEISGGDSWLAGVANGVNVTVRASTSAVYDDNIFLTKGDKVSDFIFSQTVGVNISLGDYASRSGNYLALDYSPTFAFFADNSDEDYVEHHALLEAQVTTGHWQFGAKQTFDSYDGTSVDTGAVEIHGRVRLDSYNTALSARYDITDRTFFTLLGDLEIRDYEEQLDSEELRGQATLQTFLSPKVTAGFGGVFGTVDVDDRGNETYQQALVILNYKPTARLSIGADAGVDFRQTDGDENGDDDNRTEFVYGLSLEHQPFDGTVFALEGHRHIDPSAIAPGQNLLMTGVSAGVRQRLLNRLTFGVKGGFDHVSYEGPSSTEPGLDYDYYFVKPSLSVSGRWWDLELYYMYRSQQSDAEEFGFDNNQVGVQFSVTF